METDNCPFFGGAQLRVSIGLEPVSSSDLLPLCKSYRELYSSPHFSIHLLPSALEVTKLINKATSLAMQLLLHTI